MSAGPSLVLAAHLAEELEARHEEPGSDHVAHLVELVLDLGEQVVELSADRDQLLHDVALLFELLVGGPDATEAPGG